MNHKLRLAALTTLFLILASSAFAGIKPATHSGFYVGFGLGWGSLKVELDNNNVELDNNNDDVSFLSDAESGGAGNLRAGAALSNKLLLGVEANSWVKNYNVESLGDTYDAKITVSNVAIALTYYPSEQFFIKGGPAFANARLEFDVPETVFSGVAKDDGAGLMLGAGGEFRLTRRFAIVPSAQWMFQQFDDYKINFFSITLGVGWFW
jgi:hypothetical protein